MADKMLVTQALDPYFLYYRYWKEVSSRGLSLLQRKTSFSGNSEDGRKSKAYTM